MPAAVRRRFTIGDGMVLIGTSAVGLWLLRWWHYYFDEAYPNPHSGHVFRFFVLPLFKDVAWLLLPLTVALVALRLRPPRPRGLRLLRQAGMQAAIATGFAFLIHSLNFGVWALRRRQWGGFAYSIPLWLESACMDFQTLFGPGVALAWLIAHGAGARRVERNWIDRGLRSVGWAWILLWIASEAGHAWTYLQ